MPGRYGAVVNFHMADGRKMRRFATLFRLPEEWKDGIKTNAALPGPALPEAQARDSDSSMRGIKWSMNEPMRSGDAAIILSALFELKDHQGAFDFCSSPANADKQWWVSLRRKLYHLDQKYSRTIECPVTIDKAAPVLREG